MLTSSIARNKYLLVAAIFAAVVVADHTTKYLAVGHLTSAFERHGATTFFQRVGVYLRARNLGGGSLEPEHPDLRTAAAVVIPGLWDFRYVENPGAAWSMFANQATWFRMPFFHIVSIIAIAFLIAYIRRVGVEQRWTLVALSLVLGGAFGNYLNRLIHTYVIDFVVWPWFDNPKLIWPTFNVADSAISVGVVLLVGESFFAKRSSREERNPAPALPTGTL
jgi:signal peptidase II